MEGGHQSHKSFLESLQAVGVGSESYMDSTLPAAGCSPKLGFEGPGNSA
jgi:hypothetical protein